MQTVKRKGLSIYVRIAAILLFAFGARAEGTNDQDYQDGARDFSELVERIHGKFPTAVKFNKDGAVEYLAAGFVSDANLVLISKEPSIRELRFVGWRVTDKGLAALQQMTTLERLKIARSNALQIVSPLKKLRGLDLWCSNLKPADLPYLIRMTNLVELRMRSGWMLGTNAISALTSLTQLKKLEFGGGVYSDDKENFFAKPIEELINLPGLEELELLGFRSFEDDELRKLAHLPNLKSLKLDHIKVSDNWMSIVRQSPTLTNAVVSGQPDGYLETQTWHRRQ